MEKNLGKFDVREEISQNSLSTSYLVTDPATRKDAVLRIFRGGNPGDYARSLEVARIMSKIRHDNVGGILELGEIGRAPFVLSEFIPGTTLTDYMQKAGALTPLKAIPLMRGILDALNVVHQQMSAHRSLKPNNIILTESGTPVVRDFGMGPTVPGALDSLEESLAVLAYQAPEFLEKRVMTPASDVFIAGLILYRLLFGKPAISGNDPYVVTQNIIGRDVLIPADLAAAIDSDLLDILARAIARDPVRRYKSASELRLALENYLDREEPVPDAKGQSTLEFLLRRMRHKSDFPALSESVSCINKITASETDGVNQLSAVILKDIALTNKLLRLVNSAFYRQAGGGNISTVSRAVMVLGFDAVRNLAITIILFEHLRNKPGLNRLMDEFLRANLSGILARNLGASAKMHDVEQSFICSVFHSLGRLLSQYYFPEESEAIRKQAVQKQISEDKAASVVLGISFEDLGLGVAKSWGFPQLIQNCMQHISVESLSRPQNQADRLKLLSVLSNEISASIADADPADRGRIMKKISARFAAVLPMEDRSLQETVALSLQNLVEFARAVRLPLSGTSIGGQVSAWLGIKDVQEIEGAGGESSATDSSPGEAVDDEEIQSILTCGIQDISNTLVEDFKLNDLLRIIIETIYRALGFRSVLMAVRDGRSNAMVARFGLGADVNDTLRKFQYPLQATEDVFLASLKNGVDILISDTNDPKMQDKIPAWYRQNIAMGTFLILPLVIKGNPVAMIYADKENAGEIVVSEKVLKLLRTLRNQAVLAIKQSS